jgi:putative ABC transport system permease protein
MFNDLFFRLRALFRRDAVESEADAELRFHFDQQVEKNVKAGLTREEAVRRARLDFGGHEQLKEELRDARGVNLIETLFQDIRYGLRILGRTPFITSVAILSLALGIGANTAIFSLIDSVMLRLLPVQSPEQLALIKFRSPASVHLRQSATNPIWEQVRDHQDAFSGVIAWSPDTFDLAYGGEVNNIHGIYASGSYFTTLGVRPAAGRLIAASDDVRGCGGVAVLSYGFWRGHYAEARSAVGSTIRLNGHSFPIIGVVQRGFFGTEIGVPLDVAIPVCAEAILDGKDSMLDDRSSWWLEMMGRLKTGMTVEQADARMRVISPQLFGAVVPQDWPAKYQDVFRKYTFAILPGDTGTGGNYGLREQYKRPLEILMFVVGLVLLIACANIASLLLARSAARRKEIAVRLSLGASRGRLVRQVLTESVVLSGAGAILGVFFARWCSSLMVRFVSTQQSQVFLDLRMDGRVLGFTTGIAVLCGLLFGILPALRGTLVDTMAAIKEGQAQAAGGWSHSSAVRWIVSVQVALSLILLIGAGLFVRTFANLMAVNAGFDLKNVLMVETNIHKAQIPGAARASLYEQMLAKLQVIPGVVSVSQCWMTPLSGHQWDNSVTIPGRPLPTGFDPDTFLNWVTPRYFETMRTPVLEGRTFDAHDTAFSTPVVIVNQLLARRYFGGQSPIGEHLLAGAVGSETSKLLRQPMEIIGVVQDSKYNSLDEDFMPEAYFPLSQIQRDVAENTAFEIRTAMTPGALVPAVREALGSVSKLASLQFTTLKQKAGDTVAQEHLLAVLSGFFGGLALLLTAIGLYGVMAYVVTLRTHEIGIRLALGAQRNSVLRLVMRDAAIVLVAGIAAGLLGAIWITRLVKGLLFELAPNDPVTMALALAAMVMVAFVATYIPTRRAMSVDPMVALRYE